MFIIRKSQLQLDNAIIRRYYAIVNDFVVVLKEVSVFEE